MDTQILERDSATAEEKIDKYLDLICKTADALDNTLYVLLEDASERCEKTARELLKLIMKLNILVETTLVEAGHPDHLMKKVDECVSLLAEKREWMAYNVFKGRGLAEKVEEVLINGLNGAEEALDLIADESIVLTDAFEDDGNKFISLSLMYGSQSKTKDSLADGIDLEWKNGSIHLIRMYDDGKFSWQFKFDEDQEGGEFFTGNPLDAKNSEKSSIVPLVGSAAVLATAAFVKIKNAVGSRTKKPASFEEKAPESAEEKK